MRLPPLPTIREIIRLYKLKAQKHLSQNFLLNPNVIKRLVQCGGELTDCHVCEVGPGPGGISRAILEAGASRLIVVEKDQRFLPGLQLLNEASGGRVEIHHGDVLQFDMSHLFPDDLAKPWHEPPPKIHLMGNLPFSVSTPLIIKWLHQMSERTGPWRYGRTKLTLTFQKEVAERMVAGIGHEQRSRLSIMCQNLADVRLKYTISGKSFMPPPDVDVGVVTLVPHKEPNIKLPFHLVEKLVRHVFHYRQMKCKHSVRTLFPPDRPDLTLRMFADSGVNPTSRPMKLSMDEFRRLCHVYNDICNDHQGIFEYDYRSKENAKAWRRDKLPLDVNHLEVE